MLYKVVWSRW